MAKNIQALLNLSAEKLSAAESLFKLGFYRDVLSRAYYSMYHVAQAMLLSEGKTAKGHAGTVSAFNHWFVKTKKIPERYAISFTLLKEEREFADYESLKNFSSQNAQEAIKDAEEFLEMAGKYLKKKYRHCGSFKKRENAG